MLSVTQTKNSSLTQEETRQAETTAIALNRLLENGEVSLPKTTLHLSLSKPDGNHDELQLPEATIPLLFAILHGLGSGKNVAVLSTDAEMTTQQGAEFLKVSRPYFVKLLEEGSIPFRLVGPRRRVHFADILQYKEREDALRHEGLDELVAEAQELGLY